jgi:hypothetical protein
LLLASAVDLEAPQTFDGELPTAARVNPRDLERSRPSIEPGDRLVAVVAGRIAEGALVEASLTDLTKRVKGRRLEWKVPAGKWRLMAFWLTDCSSGPVVDHLSKAAMERYCNYLGDRFRAAFGEEFGKTVDSFFADSFEVPIWWNGIYWNSKLLAEFKARKGYDLVRYLPALWWEVGEVSCKIRYDVNESYGFVTDILAGAGRSHIPEMEITAGSAITWRAVRPCFGMAARWLTLRSIRRWPISGRWTRSCTTPVFLTARFESAIWPTRSWCCPTVGANPRRLHRPG